ncbi:MAG: hypothetical protein ACJ79H_10075 [Myxococcales bacterium]
MKPGIKTTEFWVSLAAGIWGALEPAAPSWARAIVPAVVSVAYALSRGLAKSSATAGLTVGNP